MNRITKAFAVATLALLATTTVFAQGPYLRFNLGYAMPTGGNMDIDEEGTSMTVSYLAYGGGINLAGAAGMMFNDNVGLELGLNYWMGNKSISISGSATSGGIFTETTRYNSFRLLPALFLTTANDGPNLYSRFGLIVGLMNTGIENTEFVGSGATGEMTRKYTGGLAVGFMSAAGVSFPMGDKLQLFGELTFHNLNYSPTRSEVTEATLNGEDVLKDMKEVEKKTLYSKTFSINPNHNEDVPARELRFKAPASGFGFNIGIKMNLF